MGSSQCREASYRRTGQVEGGRVQGLVSSLTTTSVTLRLFRECLREMRRGSSVSGEQCLVVVVLYQILHRCVRSVGRIMSVAMYCTIRVNPKQVCRKLQSLPLPMKVKGGYASTHVCFNCPEDVS